jgi:hypothetical protein
LPCVANYFFFVVFFAAFFAGAFFAAFLADDFFAAFLAGAFFAADFLVAAFFTAKGIPRLLVDFLVLALFLLPTAFAALLPLFAPLVLFFAADFVTAFLAGAFLAGAFFATALAAAGGAAVFLAADFLAAFSWPAPGAHRRSKQLLTRNQSGYDDDLLLLLRHHRRSRLPIHLDTRLPRLQTRCQRVRTVCARPAFLCLQGFGCYGFGSQTTAFHHTCLRRGL